MPTTPDSHAVLVVGQTLEVNDVVSIVETEAVLDPETGDWAREIQIFRDREGAANSVLVLTIKLKGEQKSNIYFHAPGQDY